MSFSAQHLLIPVAIGTTKGAELARTAVDASISLCQATGGRITIMFKTAPLDDAATSDPEDTGTFAAASRQLKERLASVQERLEDLERRAQAAGVDATAAVVANNEGTTESICAYATEIDADVIVLCSHGRRGWQRVMLGSVAEDVVNKSPVPVLVLRGDKLAKG